MWQKFDEEKITEYVRQGKTVFVDVTADWCLTCKANEILVLETTDMRELFSHDNPVAMQADWTNGDAKITTFMRRFGKYGVPFYAVFSPEHPDGISLPEVLTTNIVNEAVK